MAGIAADPVGMVGLTALMEISAGSPDIAVGLIDGPVAVDHPDLAAKNIRCLSLASGGTTASNGAATVHGTFVAGILSANRGSPAPAICPECTLLVRPIFAETSPSNGSMPSAKPEELAKLSSTASVLAPTY